MCIEQRPLGRAVLGRRANTSVREGEKLEKARRVCVHENQADRQALTKFRGDA